MNRKDLFLKTLKRIDYHEVDFVYESDIDSWLSEEKLKSFFEEFSTLNENNVLTTDEIEQYSALTSYELAEIEDWKKTGQLQKIDAHHENKKEALSLKEQCAQIENHNKCIEKQIESFKKHEKHLLETKEIQQNLVLRAARKKFQSYELNEIPQVEEEFLSSLKSVLEVAQDLESLIVHTDTSQNKLPSSNYFRDIVQQYLNTETNVLQHVKLYWQDNFQLQGDDICTFIADENSYRQELIKETSFLQRVFKNKIIDKVLSENEARKTEIIAKYFENTIDFNCHLSQLKFKLDDSLKLNQQLKRKEEELKGYIFSAVSKQVDALVNEIDLSATNETIDMLKFCIERMSLPMKILIHQRARLELLISLIYDHKEELLNIKKLIQKVLNDIKLEKSHLEERKVLIENKITDVAQKDQKLELESVLLSSLYKILRNLEDSDLPVVSPTDVIQMANKLLGAKENCAKESKEKMEIIDLLEKHAHSMELFLKCADQDYSNWRELEHEFNINLNNLVLKLGSLEESLTECSQDLDQKKKILETKSTMRRARNLFIYALLEEKYFKKCIHDIKTEHENATGCKL